MRLIRSTTAIVSAACLLFGSTAAVLAQAEGSGPMAPVPFTASLACSDEVATMAGSGGEEQTAPGLTVLTLPTPTWSMTVEGATDPRLDGQATFAMNGVIYWDGPSVAEAADPSLADVMTGSLHIQNDEGAWEGTTYLLSLADEPQFAADVVALAGSATYDGLVALAEMRQGDDVCAWDLKGAIIEGGLPPAPAIPAE